MDGGSCSDQLFILYTSEEAEARKSSSFKLISELIILKCLLISDLENCGSFSLFFAEL